MNLADKHIVLGITGGIAAYKAPFIVRGLTAAGAQVQVVMSANAHEFVTATSLQAVAGTPVRDNLWDHAAEAAMGHIELARWADLLLVAPATADLIARLAAGRADDLLTTTALATAAPLLLAPAMNADMWANPICQRNLSLLRELLPNLSEVGPEEGWQACRTTGGGRMSEPEAIRDAIAGLLR